MTRVNILLLSHLYNGRALCIDDPLRASRQPVYLPFSVPSGAYSHYLLYARYVLSSTVFNSFSKILQAHRRCAVVGSSLVVRRGFQIFYQIRPQAFGAREVGGDDAEESPASLTTLRIRTFVVCRLFHQLAIDLIAKRLEFVTMLKEKKGNVFQPVKSENAINN